MPSNIVAYLQKNSNFHAYLHNIYVKIGNRTNLLQVNKIPHNIIVKIIRRNKKLDYLEGVYLNETTYELG